MITGLSDVEKKINDLKTELQKLEDIQEKIKTEDQISQSDEGQIATALHDVLCRANHTDGCGWLYEIQDGVHQWDYGDHKRWLRKARYVMKYADATVDTIYEVLQVLKKLYRI